MQTAPAPGCRGSLTAPRRRFPARSPRPPCSGTAPTAPHVARPPLSSQLRRDAQLSSPVPPARISSQIDAGSGGRGPCRSPSSGLTSRNRSTTSSARAPQRAPSSPRLASNDLLCACSEGTSGSSGTSGGASGLHRGQYAHSERTASPHHLRKLRARSEGGGRVSRMLSFSSTPAARPRSSPRMLSAAPAAAGWACAPARRPQPGRGRMRGEAGQP